MSSRAKHRARSKYSYMQYKAYDMFRANGYSRAVVKEHKANWVERIRQLFKKNTTDKKGE